MRKKTVRDVDVRGKRVLVRVDFNVPLEDTRITDDSRIQATLPTIRYLIERGARIILCSHLGRPGGKAQDAFRLGPVAQRLSELLGKPVHYVTEAVGPAAEEAVARLEPGELLLLENIRFHPGEEKGDPALAQALACLADLFVNDAFGAAHRAHASVVGVAQHLQGVAGFLLEREMEMLGQVLHNPHRPLGAVMGGAKLGDKINILENLLGRLDRLLVGGGMVATFFKALGYQVGRSLVEEERVETAARALGTARQRGIPLLLPEDLVVAEEFSASAPYKIVEAKGIPAGWFIMDIGPRTGEAFERTLRGCRTVFWNGPMGVVEFPPFAVGTRRLAQCLASLNDAITVVGGGSTAEAVQALGLAERMTHVSTGGGASLEFLEGKQLPGVAALADRE